MRRVDKNVLNVKCVKGECHLRSHPLPLELEGQARLSPCDIAIGNLGVAYGFVGVERNGYFSLRIGPNVPFHWVDSEDFIAEMEMLRLQVMLFAPFQVTDKDWIAVTHGGIVDTSL